jgi:hypothetical protein
MVEEVTLTQGQIIVIQDLQVILVATPILLLVNGVVVDGTPGVVVVDHIEDIQIMLVITLTLLELAILVQEIQAPAQLQQVILELATQQQPLLAMEVQAVREQQQQAVREQQGQPLLALQGQPLLAQ